eukprot:6194275-Pleurochrysis_carterae.AAC.3
MDTMSRCWRQRRHDGARATQTRPHRLALALVALIPAHVDCAWTGLLGLTFESDEPVEAKSLHCPTGFITGIRIRYGRTRQARPGCAALGEPVDLSLTVVRCARPRNCGLTGALTQVCGI